MPAGIVCQILIKDADGWHRGSARSVGGGDKRARLTDREARDVNRSSFCQRSTGFIPDVRIDCASEVAVDVTGSKRACDGGI
jgi:hypothetical protein